MGASTFQPPINIDPTQNPTDQVSFINQNFQSIASTLETNSFRIVDRGITSISSNGATVNWVTVPHNLGFAPIPFLNLNNVTLSNITTGGNIPLPTFSAATIDVVNHVVTFQTWIEAVADDTNLYVVLYNSTGSSISALNVAYYLVQQPSTS